MNGEGPDGVNTVTSTVISLLDGVMATAETGGAIAVIDVVESTVNNALAVPNLTSVTPIKLVPEIITGLPPDSGPLVGLMLVTTGIGAR